MFFYIDILREYCGWNQNEKSGAFKKQCRPRGREIEVLISKKLLLLQMRLQLQ